MLRTTFAVLSLLFLAPFAFGETPAIVKVEEFWTLKVRDPEPASISPQLTTSMAPDCHTGESGLYTSFCMNHQLNGDEFEAGGLQLQLWYGDHLLARKSSDAYDLLANNAETVTWTQELSVANGILTFSIKNGQSQSWGSFGPNLKISVVSPVSNLNDYCPLYSVNNSGPVFAGNRVDSIGITRVRVTYASGETAEIDATAN